MYQQYEKWLKRDIATHKSIDWKARNYEDFDTKEAFLGTAKIIRMGKPVEFIDCVFHKFIRANAIFPPYWKAVDLNKDISKSLCGPMYDGVDCDGYGVHDRYEDQKTYDLLSV